MSYVLLLAMLLPTAASTSESWQRGLAAYRDNRFKVAVEHLRAALDERQQTPPEREQELRLYLAFSLLQLGREREAREALRALLDKFPEHTIDYEYFHPKLASLYRSVSEERRVARAPEPAASSAPVTSAASAPIAIVASAPVIVAAPAAGIAADAPHREPPSPGLLFARSLPFGIGQFANGDVASGAIWLTGELLLLAANIASAVLLSLNETPYGYAIDHRREVALFATQNATFGALLLVGGFGILDAHLWSPKRR